MLANAPHFHFSDDNLTPLFHNLKQEIQKHLNRLDTTCPFYTVALIKISPDLLNESSDHYTTSDKIIKTIKQALRPCDRIIRSGFVEWIILCPGECSLLKNAVYSSVCRAYTRPFHAWVYRCLSITETTCHSADLLNESFLKGLFLQTGEISVARSFSNAPIQTSAGTKFLAQAIEEHRLSLAFQAIVSGYSGQIFYYEALARYVTPENTLQSLGNLIHSAEKEGWITALDLKVLQLALSELQAYPQLRLAINVSSITTSSDLWMETLKAYIRYDQSLAQRLIIEITETSILENLGLTKNFIAAAKGLGCAIAIDDVGAGYLSMDILQEGNIDILKFDGHFVNSAVFSVAVQHSLKAFIALARSKNIFCIAEHIETQKAAAFLAPLGIQAFQGYLYGKPKIYRI